MNILVKFCLSLLAPYHLLYEKTVFKDLMLAIFLH